MLYQLSHYRIKFAAKLVILCDTATIFRKKNTFLSGLLRNFAPMILKKLAILNFRNIAEAEIQLSVKMNCFVGQNGQGKTNVLDSIFFLSFAKSSVCSIDSQNIRHGQELMMIQGTYDLNGTEEEISVGMKLHQKKHVKRNKKEYRRLSEHIGLLPLVMVSPADSQLIQGGSDERRRFMDMVISQCDTEYLHALASYNKALMQRNALLKADEEPSTDMLDVYEELMAMHGESVFRKRTAFIEEFIPIFQQFHDTITGASETVGLNYVSHAQRGPLLAQIRASRAKDRIMGYSLHGIHKDELEMTLDGFPIKREGSQGQNKSYIIALKLAQFNALQRTGSKTAPIVLLDDIFDKLDSTRVANIISMMQQPAFGQIFITDTNRQHLDRILEHTQGDYRIFKVCAGNISL